MRLANAMVEMQKKISSEFLENMEKCFLGTGNRNKTWMAVTIM